ncbi:MAG: metallophosphoesterase [Planctomycetota bacterium]|jgi:predicted MPP superfamily phosphohydrolase
MADQPSHLPDLLAKAEPIPHKTGKHKVPQKHYTRRKLLRSTLAAGALAALGSAGYAWQIEPTWLEINRQKMTLKNLPLTFKGFRIIHISDLHLGAGVPIEYLTKCIDKINGLQPDLVVVTGDIVHHGRAEWNRPAARLLAQVKATQGVMAVLGNHDWGAFSMGKGFDHWADRVTAEMVTNGIRTLRNEAALISRGGSRLYLVGLDDYWSHNFDPQAAFKNVPPSAPCIALSHNPDSFPEILDSPATWTLAGHTHGGQVNIPLLGPPLVPLKHKQLVAGHYQLAGKNLYVNRGLGWLKRLRFNSRPEITEFTLNKV